MYLPPAPSVEPTRRRIRVRLGGQLVADTTSATLVTQYGPGLLPTYFVPRADVRDGMLTDERVDDHGNASWTVDAGGDRVVGGAYEHPLASTSLPDLAGQVSFTWSTFEWYEEDERVFVHPRIPTHRVDALRSSRVVEVYVAGQRVARSLRPVLVFETGLPTRHYLPFEDVRTDLLEPGALVTACPYKGIARYWSLRVGETSLADVAWSYPDPRPEVHALGGHLAFFDEHVDVVVDGVAQERPQTPWSRPEPPVVR